MQRSTFTAGLLVVWGWALPALAAGIEYPELGAVAVGRGGATAARPDGGLSLMFNPAGMAWQKGLRIDADGKLMWNSVSYTAADRTLVANSPSARSDNDQKFYATPTNASVIYGFGRVGPFEGLSVGLGVAGPSATGQLNYPVDGSGRYERTNIDYFFAYYSAGVAARLGESWALGLTFQLAQGTAKFTQAVRGTPGFAQATDILATVDVRSGAIPTGVVGLTYMPHPKVSLGLSYRPKVSFVGDGTLTSIFPKALAGLNPSQNGDAATLRLNFPHVIRFGAQYTPTSLWLVEFNVVGELWSVFDAARVDPHNVSVTAGGATSNLTEIVFTKQYHDAVSFRLGADYTVLPKHLTVRAGYFYETSAVPTRTVAVDFPNWGRHAVGAGVSVSVWGAQLHVSYAQHFVVSQTVTDSAITAVYVPQSVAPTPAPAVGNGSYTASSGLLAIGLSIDLNRLSTDI